MNYLTVDCFYYRSMQNNDINNFTAVFSKLEKLYVLSRPYIQAIKFKLTNVTLIVSLQVFG